MLFSFQNCFTACVLGLSLALGGAVIADDKAEKKTPAKKEAKVEKKAEPKAAEEKKKGAVEPKVATEKVKEGPLAVKSKISGIVESSKMTPIAVVPKRWTDLLVVKVVEHGAEVKEGDVLIELDRELLERKIRETKAGMPLKELEFNTLRQELEKLEKSTPITLETLRNSKMQSEEDFAYYEDVTRPMRERDAKESVKQVEQYLAYAEEELNQLKKMYNADDLTEETEEIILLRAQNEVDQYRWMLEQSKARTDRTLSTTIPREHERMERSLELSRINWRISEKATRDALEKKRLEVEAKEREMEELHRALDEYTFDLDGMTVPAPHDGIVYYGMNQRGKWTTGSTVAKKLIPGGSLTSREIVMTVTDPAKLHLRAAVPADKRKGVEPGRDAEITLKWNSEEKLTGKVQKAARVPFSDGTYDTLVSIVRGKKVDVFPGMLADAEVMVYENNKALTIPASAIKTEGKKKTVKRKGGKIAVVETGRTQGDRIEILKGLAADDEIEIPAPAKKEEPEAKKETPEKK
jgi:multidrug efflux pump subunit AcrA (membrane-fusion protein)